MTSNLPNFQDVLALVLLEQELEQEVMDAEPGQEQSLKFPQQPVLHIRKRRVKITGISFEVE